MLIDNQSSMPVNAHLFIQQMACSGNGCFVLPVVGSYTATTTTTSSTDDNSNTSNYNTNMINNINVTVKKIVFASILPKNIQHMYHFSKRNEGLPKRDKQVAALAGYTTRNRLEIYENRHQAIPASTACWNHIFGLGMFSITRQRYRDEQSCVRDTVGDNHTFSR